MNNFKYSNTNKRYYTFDYYYKKKYSQKMVKVPINLGLSCPNIDGTKSVGGCSFCNSKGSGDFAGDKEDSLLKQWNQGKENLSLKWTDVNYLAYCQSRSNTYGDIEYLKECYSFFNNLEECKEISLGTRPDCINEEIISYLASLDKPVTIELGFQTMHVRTIEKINRAYSNQEFEDAIQLLNKYNIDIVVHIINGLYDETKEEMVDTLKYVSTFNIQGIKIHLLHIMSDSGLLKEYNDNKFELLTKETYIDIVVEQLRHLREDIVVQRLTGDAPTNTFIGPTWSRKKSIVINDIDKCMAENDYYQGDLYEKS
ncbi:MAG: TIGR01212 family radical SAM protein [Mycoplasmatales bacterium]